MFKHLRYLCIFFAISNPSFALLTLDKYLQEVKEKHLGLKASQNSKEGSLLRSHEGDLMTSFNLFADASYFFDKKPGLFYSQLLTDDASLGIQKIWAFGLQSKVYYAVNYSGYQTIGFGNPTFYYGKPAIELKQSLWKNFFGRETRATLELAEANALSTHYNESYKIKMTLLEAETNYWRLALARESKQVQEEALERAQKMYEWNSRRAKLQLSEKSDFYQSQALLELRKLQQESAINEERAAAFAFNMSRGIDSPKVAESLLEIDKVLINKLEIPKRMSVREDLMALKQAQRLAEANAILAKEKNSPSLDFSASFALNGMNQSQLPDALVQSIKTDNPTITLGLKFSTPLDIGNVTDIKRGYTQEIMAADLNYQRKQFEQDQEWKDLNLKFQESKRKFELSKAIENVQKEKMIHEKERLQKGRSTTYQVLTFEQDYSSSQLSRIQAELEILQIIAKMKLFSAGEQQ